MKRILVLKFVLYENFEKFTKLLISLIERTRFYQIFLIGSNLKHELMNMACFSVTHLDVWHVYPCDYCLYSFSLMECFHEKCHIKKDMACVWCFFALSTLNCSHVSKTKYVFESYCIQGKKALETFTPIEKTSTTNTKLKVCKQF